MAPNYDYNGGSANMWFRSLTVQRYAGTAVNPLEMLEWSRGDLAAQQRILKAWDESRCEYCSGKQRDLSAVKCCHCGAPL